MSDETISQQHASDSAPDRPRDSQLAESHAAHSTAHEKARHDGGLEVCRLGFLQQHSRDATGYASPLIGILLIVRTRRLRFSSVKRQYLATEKFRNDFCRNRASVCANVHP